MTPIKRHLYCEHCDKVCEHKVYKLHQWTEVTQIVGGKPSEYEKIRYQQFCSTCKTNCKVKVPLKEWIWLYKNKDWEA